jgi:hypothetical protein
LSRFFLPLDRPCRTNDEDYIRLDEFMSQALKNRTGSRDAIDNNSDSRVDDTGSLQRIDARRCLLGNRVGSPNLALDPCFP